MYVCVCVSASVKDTKKQIFVAFFFTKNFFSKKQKTFGHLFDL